MQNFWKIVACHVRGHWTGVLLVFAIRIILTTNFSTESNHQQSTEE